LEDYEVEQQILANENRRGRPYQRWLGPSRVLARPSK